MKYELKGLNKIKSNISKMDNDIKNRPSVIMTPSFISSCSQYLSFDELIKASGLKIESKDEIDATLNQEWDQFIQKTTSYDSWTEMRSAAASSYLKANLTKGLK